MSFCVYWNLGFKRACIIVNCNPYRFIMNFLLSLLMSELSNSSLKYSSEIKFHIWGVCGGSPSSWTTKLTIDAQLLQARLCASGNNLIKNNWNTLNYQKIKKEKKRRLSILYLLLQDSGDRPLSILINRPWKSIVWGM